MTKFGVVVSGLPASGKTTIALALARALEITALDKDDFLEALYAEHHVASWSDRKRLSRQSDMLFARAAREAGSAVLVSHWRPPGSRDESGTPTEWLTDTYECLVEVFCQCPPDVALARFVARKRHPGHLDTQRDPADLAQRFASWERRYPLGIGTPIVTNTEHPADVDATLKEVRARLRVA